MELTKIKINELIVPKRLIFRNELYRILDYPNKYLTTGYRVVLVDGKIDEIEIDNLHPNANPRTGELCIPNSLRDFSLNDESKKMIYNILSCFNLDNCYFTPWDEIQYRKQEV